MNVNNSPLDKDFEERAYEHGVCDGRAEVLLRVKETLAKIRKWSDENEEWVWAIKDVEREFGWVK